MSVNSVDINMQMNNHLTSQCVGLQVTDIVSLVTVADTAVSVNKHLSGSAEMSDNLFQICIHRLSLFIYASHRHFQSMFIFVP